MNNKHTHTQKQRQSGKQSKHRNCVLKRYLLHPLCIRVDIILLLSSSTIYTLTEQQQRKQYQIQMFFFLFLCKTNALFFLYTYKHKRRSKTKNNDDDTNNGTWSVYLQTFLLFFGFSVQFFSFIFQKYDKFLCTFLISKEEKEKNIIVHKMRRNWQKFFFLGKHYMLHIDDDAHSKETLFLYVSLSPSSSNILECKN